MDNQSQPCQSHVSNDNVSTMVYDQQYGDKLRALIQKDVECGQEPHEELTDTSSAALVRKRFRDFMDEPETWEKNLIPKQSSSLEVVDVQNISKSSEPREDNDEERESRSKRRRRNAIKPNSMTQRVAKDVADCYHLEKKAAATGRVLNAEDIALSGLRDRFKDASVGATKDSAGDHDSAILDA